MKVCAYLHAFRCLEPCGGVGRHANSILSRLAVRPDVDLSLLINRKYVSSTGELPENFPLREIPFYSYPGPELLFEKTGRAINWPKMDRWMPGADWYYSPMEGRLPVRSGRNMTTIHDVQALEPDLPWSDTPEHKAFRRKWEFWLPKAFRTVDRILTVSEFSKQRMIDLMGAPPDRIAVIGNGVDDAFYEAGDRLIGQSDKRPEIVIVGGLRYKKGADHVFEVADVLKRMDSPLQIVVIGQSESDYLERAKQHPKIECHGMLPDPEMIDRVAHATALMLLSLYEGFGIPALEAMASGTPAVVSDRSSLPEVVGEAGFIFDPRKSEEVAEFLGSLVPNSESYAAIQKNGREHAEQYRWDRCVDRLCSAIAG